MKNTIGSLTVFLTILLGFMAIPEGFVLPSESEKSVKQIAGLWDHKNEKTLKLIGTDEETGTYFRMIDKSRGIPGTNPCKGYSGKIEIIGEVPSNVSLEDDTIAKALINKGKELAMATCPKFRLSLADLDIRLFKTKYTGNKNNTEVWGFWGRVYAREAKEALEKGPMKYRNFAFERAKLAAEVIKPLSDKVFLFLCGTDNETGTEFWIYSDSRTLKCDNWNGWYYQLFGVVPKEVSLLDKLETRALIDRGTAFLREDCPVYNAKEVRIKLVPEAYKASFRHAGSFYPEPVLVKAVISREESNRVKICNYVLQAEQRKRKREQEREQERLKKLEVRKRFDEFVTKNHVEDWPPVEKLSVNPFVYVDKTVAIVSKFKTMVSATEGLLETQSEPFLVSNIPEGLFTSEARVIIAGRVLGKEETKLPLVGAVLVPHLKFVGVHFCRDWKCSDIIAK